MPPRTDFFAPFFVVAQKPSHCGPASLASALEFLGIRATQEDAAKATGGNPRLRNGTDEHLLKITATKLGAAHTELRALGRGDDQTFVEGLRRHLIAGFAAVLYLPGHWVAVLGYIEAKAQFIVMDPNDNDRQFNQWKARTLVSEARQEDSDADERLYALLLRRADSKPARWQLSEKLVKLCEKGADETAEEIVQTLEEIGARAKSANTAEPLPWAEVLGVNRKPILESATHWVGEPAVSKKEVSELYDAYVAVAEAAKLSFAGSVQDPCVVAQLTAVFTEYAARER